MTGRFSLASSLLLSTVTSVALQMRDKCDIDERIKFDALVDTFCRSILFEPLFLKKKKRKDDTMKMNLKIVYARGSPRSYSRFGATQFGWCEWATISSIIMIIWRISEDNISFIFYTN